MPRRPCAVASYTNKDYSPVENSINPVGTKVPSSKLEYTYGLLNPVWQRSISINAVKDANLTWHTDSPRLTTCFEKTVLVWIPSLFLWAFSGVDIYFSLNSKTKNIPWNWRNVSKLVIVGVLIAVCVFEFIFNWFGAENAALVDLYTPLLKIVTLAICAGLIFSHKICGRRTSGVLFIFWLLVVIFGVPQFLSDLEARSQGIQLPTQIAYMIFYVLSVVSFSLNLFADIPPIYFEHPIPEKPCPEDNSSFLSKLTFSWFDSLAYLGFKNPLVQTDLWSIRYSERASQIFSTFDKHWTATLKKNSQNYPGKRAECRNRADVNNTGKGKAKVKSSSILPAICKAFGPSYIFGSCLMLCEILLAFVSPLLLQYLIGFIESDDPQWHGFLYAGLLFIVASCQTLLLAQYDNLVKIVGLRIRTALISAIYRKALKLSNAARKESTVGEIANLMSVDAEQFMEVVDHLNMIWSAPLQIILSLYFLWQILGPSVLAGLSVMVLFIPINSYIANRYKILKMKKMKNMDERVKMMNEILSGIKVLKLYSWESSFEQQVMKIRGREIKLLKQSTYLDASTSFIWICMPFLVSATTFAVYLMSDEKNVLDASKAFVALTLFNIMKMPLIMLPHDIVVCIEASVSVKRINKFMNNEEIDPTAVSHDYNNEEPLVMERGTFSWGIDEEPTLFDINLRVKDKSLVAVVGTVGSGKSSLISAFLGEMDKIEGRVNIQGTVAYVPQLAWIQNATLKDNILFGKSFNYDFYQEVVKSCALKQDLEVLAAGEQTEIGENGINLSGGQKQRVSLARAVYADCDIYFLDDPLSAVDSHVGKHIFENVISSKGMLKKKTRIFATHSISFLPEVDQIVVLKEGTISEIGTYRELLENKGAFSEFLSTYMQEFDNENLEALDSALREQILSSHPEIKHKLSRQISVSSGSSSISSITEKVSHSNLQWNEVRSKISTLIEEEKAEIGEVKLDVYKYYLQSIGLGLTLGIIVFNILYEGFSVGSNLWLSHWSNDAQKITINGTQNTDLRNMYLEVYCLFGLGQCITSIFTDIFPKIGCCSAALNLHKALLTSILHAPLSFMDTTPQGRILSRFSKDVDVLDDALPYAISGGLYCFFDVIATFIVISSSMPTFITVILPIGVIYYFLQRFYIATSRQLKRLESVSRSPIYSHFGESVSGCSCIRAYNVQDRFIKESDRKVDLNQICTYPEIIANGWLEVRLEMIGNFIIFFSALFSVLGRGSLSPGIVGLAVSYSLEITHLLNLLVRMTVDIETDIVAVERVKEYIEIPQEAPLEITQSSVSRFWPEEGKVEFKDFKVRYRPGLDLVLTGVSFTVNGGEKVGIVGRTGAGKSSLTLSLFRIIEAADGKIFIDDVDISELGLHALRSRLTIIPQDPVLFSGTLRINLDPFGKYSDEQILRALELAHLKTYVQGLTAGLQHEVLEGGENLSVGQRQLICLARALLRKTKVLVLDEATAAVDLETDDLIQKTIRSEFKHCTVLTIAHRLNTILDSDRVLVMDKGTIAEFDSPVVLLKNKSSLFYGMAHDAGLI